MHIIEDKKTKLQNILSYTLAIYITIIPVPKYWET